MISILFYLMTAFTANADEWRFEVKNRLGFEEVYILQKINGEFYFNGKSLGKKLEKSFMHSWNQIVQGPEVEFNNNCSAGYYLFTSKVANQVKTIEGCAHGNAYANYRVTFDKLHDSAKYKK